MSSKRGCKRVRRGDFRYLYLAPVLALLLAGFPGSAVKGGSFGTADSPIVKATTTAQLSAAGEIQHMPSWTRPNLPTFTGQLLGNIKMRSGTSTTPQGDRCLGCAPRDQVHKRLQSFDS